MLSTLFIDTDATPGGDGLSWATAFDDLQAGLTAAEVANADGNAENDVEAIWIAEGVYRPSTELEAGDARSASFSLVDGVTLYGGFIGTEASVAERDLGAAHETILSGDLGVVDDVSDNAYTVVYCGEEVEAGVDGVLVVGGNADGGYGSSHLGRRYGGGILNLGTLTITNTTISRNATTGYGGGIHNSTTLTIVNTTISENAATFCGGGISNSGALTITNSSVSENTAANSGGGVFSSGAATIVNSTLSENSAGTGGGIYRSSGTTTVTNCILGENSARAGGGIYGNYSWGSSGTVIVTNSTLSGNSASQNGGGVFGSDSGSKIILNNTVVAGNVSPSGPDVFSDFDAVSGKNNLIGNGAGQSGLIDGRNGNQVGSDASPIDPLLSDWTQLENGQWGFLVLPGSPALNGGDNSLALNADGEPLSSDALGNPRIIDGTVDIGAMEGATAGTPGQTYLVTSLERTIADDGELTFFEAFDAAYRNRAVADAPAGSFSESDSIQFAEGVSGTVFVDGEELTILGSLDIVGPGREFLTFDAGSRNRVFLIGANISVSLSGMTVTGGLADYGGGIYSNGELSLTNVGVTGNSAIFDGGGIYNNAGSLSAIGSSISGNSSTGTGARGNGGGVYNSGGIVSVMGSILSENSASRQGGGIYSSKRAEVAVKDSSLSRNSADARGGAVASLGTLVVDDSTVSENSAEDDGGGIYSEGALAIACSSFVENSSKSSGGAIYTVSSSATVTNSTLAENTAVDSGGAIFAANSFDSSSLTVTNSTLSWNFAGSGGGICLAGSSSNMLVNNSIVALNWATADSTTSGSDILVTAGTLAGSHNIVGDGSGQSSLRHGISANQVGTASSPIDPLLSEWTQFENGLGGYRLLSGSPAIDAGDNGLAVDSDGVPLDRDIVGNPRIEDDTVDIGAAERTTAGIPAQTYVVTSLEESIAEDGVLTFVEAFEAANWNRRVGDAAPGSFSEQDIIRFAEGVSGTVNVDDGELVVRGDLCIEGPGSELLAFDAGGENRVFFIRPHMHASLSGMNVVGGSADNGGGIYGSPHSILTVVDCTIAENEATDSNGGGICSHGVLTVENSTFLRNSARYGAGIRGYSESVTLTNSMFVENTATLCGAGVYSSGRLTVASSAFRDNSADHSGGSVYMDYRSETASIIATTFVGNSAFYYGGAIYDDSASLTVANSIFAHNSAEYHGGAIRYSGSDELTITNSTIAWNSAESGGGIYNSSSTAEITLNNTIVAANWSSSESASDVYDKTDTLWGYYNLIGVGLGQSRLVNGINGNQVGNVASPLDPLLSEWTPFQNGLGGYYPMPGSPAVDTGNQSLALGLDGEPLATDICGNLRIAGDAVDIGAVEGTLSGRSAEVYLVTSLDQTVAEDGVLTFSEALEAANLNRTVADAPAGSFSEPDIIRFADGLSGTITVDNGELTIVGNLRIEGPGDGLVTLESQGQNRVLLISPCISATLIGLTVTGGSADYGGGICNRGNLTLIDVTLKRNAADVSGGGICNSSSGTLELLNSSISGNSSTGTEEGNGGGGIYNSQFGILTVTDSIFSGNLATGGPLARGGGVYNDAGTLTVTNSTIVANAAEHETGGIYCLGPMTVVNTIFWQNAGGDFGDRTDVSSVQNLIGIEPTFVRDPNPGPDANWGTGDDDYGDLRLTARSPAIDYGQNPLLSPDTFDLDGDGDTIESVSLDRDGHTRIFGSSVDCGAFELQTEVAPGREVRSLTVTTSEDVFDLYDNRVSLREAIWWVDQPAQDATVTFSAELDGSATMLHGQPLLVDKPLAIDASALDSFRIDADGQSRVFVINAPTEEVELKGLTIAGGSADRGGGIYSTCMLTLTDCRLLQNAASYGGGVYTFGVGTVTVKNSELSRNSASDEGGAIHSSGTGGLSMTNSTIWQNSATSAGGGIFSTSSLAVANSTFADNKSGEFGGAVFGLGGPITLTNSTLTENFAERRGGGIYISDSDSEAVLNNTIVAANWTNSTSPDLFHYGNLFSGSHNLIGIGSSQGKLVNGVDGNQVGTDSSPINPLLSEWTRFSNGLGGCYPLPGSPALNAGNDALAIGPDSQQLDRDICGNPRIEGGSVDIGAVEGEAPGTPAQTYVVTSLEKTVSEDGILTFFEAFQAANWNQPVGDASAGSFTEQDTIQFADGLSGEILIDDGELAIVGNLQINGPGDELLAFDACGQNRVFSIARYVSVGLNGITVTGGSADYGGGIYNRGDLTVADSTVSGNSANNGGGIYSCNYGTLTIVDSTVSENTAAGNGGGICIYESSAVAIEDSTIAENTAGQYGGGIHNSHSDSLLITGSKIQGNSSGRHGGGAYNEFCTLTITNCTVSENSVIYSGSDYHGGAVHAEFCDVTVTDSTLSGNVARDGGGIYGKSVVLVVTNSTLSQNTAKRNGGGIYGKSVVLEVADSILSENTANNSGGGIYSAENGSSVSIADCTLSGNSAKNYGGGIVSDRSCTVIASTLSNNIAGSQGGGGAISNGGPLTIEDCTFIENSAFMGGAIRNAGSGTITSSDIARNEASMGGGVYNSGTLTVTDSVLSQNVASYSGGGSYNGGELSVMNCTLSENTAERALTYDGGGGIWSSETLTVTNSVLARNTATGAGGGIHGENGALTIVNCTLSENSASRGGGICTESGISEMTMNNTLVAGNSAPTRYGPDAYYSGYTPLDSHYHNLMAITQGVALSNGKQGNQIGTTSSPIDALLSEWTYFENGHSGYCLLPGSPAIDAGNDALALDPEREAISEDISGGSRIIGDTVDIGAIEAKISPRAGEVYVVTSLDATIAKDGVLTFLEAFTAANVNWPTGDAPAGSFTEPDTICFSENVAGTIAVDDGQLEILGNLTIEGPGHDLMTFDAQGNNRVFYIQPLVSFTLSGVTVTGGAADYGGGIHSLGELNLADSILTENFATEKGGSIYCRESTLNVTSSTISNSSANIQGGGVYCSRGTLTVADSTVAGNYVPGVGDYLSGGGIYAYACVLDVTDSVFEGNSALSGGAIYNNGRATITRSTFLRNRAPGGHGGAIYNEPGHDLAIANSSLTQNTADAGGAICSGRSGLLVTNTAMYGNVATASGGAVYFTNTDNSRGTFRNCTISGNSAGSSGGGIYCGSSLLFNTIVAENTAPSAPDIHVVPNATLSGSNNLIGDGTGQTGLADGTDANLVGTAESPIDPLFILNPSDGGDGWGDDPNTPNLDESLNDDYGDLRLRPNSPAVDAGSDDLLPADEFDLDGDGDVAEPIPFDLAGNARIENGGVDMGAYEYAGPVFVPGDLNGDEMVSGDDLDIVRANWGRSVAAGSLLDGDPSGDGVVGGDDLDIVRGNWGNTAPAAAGVDVVLEQEAELWKESLESERKNAGVYGPLPRTAANEGVANMTGQDQWHIWAAAMDAWGRDGNRDSDGREGEHDQPIGIAPMRTYQQHRR